MKRISGLRAYTILYLVFLYLPVFLLPLFSFNDGTIVAFPIKGWTLEWYRQLGAQDTLIQALVNSLLVGVVSAFAATSMGLFAARAYVRFRFPGKQASEGLVMLPLVVPGIIVASSMLVLFISMGLKPSLTAIVLGHTFLALPFSVSIMKSAFDDFDVSLEEAAFDLGSGAVETFRRVTLPIVAPGIVSSLLVSFTVSFDEFVLAFFLSGNQ
ncbi:MAG: ABC transporter permease, partial [Rhodobacteraceae bacterium]|nr:ABC transporter permease [Paracoccaceae bacterium]